jgi:plastocyanin
MRLKSSSIILAILVGLSVSLGCSKPRAQQSSSAAGAPAPAPIDPDTVAYVSGTVDFTGDAPKPVNIDMSNDPACRGTNASEAIVVHDGKLANVFVYVKDGLGNRTFAPPASAVAILQEGCRYLPHVAGVMVGQPVEIKNDDPTEHNVHAIGMENAQWNESQMPKAAPIEKSFDHPEVMLPIKCNQHPWMKMYMNVVSNPFYAVTDAKGHFALTGLPPGEYTIAFVQEKLGEQDQKIVLTPKDRKTLDIGFKEQ